MLFEVIKDKKIMMYTNDEECMPSLDTLTEMTNAGYSFKMDKKIWLAPKKKRKKSEE